MIKILLLLALFVSTLLQADVIKPVLVEISFYQNKTAEISIDLSLEGAISGIGTQYKNTIDSPNAAQYDTLRALEPDVLRERFKDFEAEFLNSFEFSINNKVQKLALKNTKIDIVGYKKRPRKTVLIYQVQLNEWPKTLEWQYGKIYGDSALRWQMYKKDEYNWSQWQWLREGNSSGIIDINHTEPVGMLKRFIEFVKIGFDHVIPLGWDHILFIIGMALSSLFWNRLLVLVSSFTLAHTLTLGLAMFGLVEISPRIIEPLIAFSIAYVAIENLLIKQSIKRKTLVVFIFGLIHGLGFASMLKNFEMTSEYFLTTLIGFNIGVELAQIVIIFTVVAVLIILRALKFNYRQLAVIPTSIIIALIGFYWGIERLIG
jgi:hypothetical protein